MKTQDSVDSKIVVAMSFTLRLFYPRRKSPCGPLDESMGGSQSRSGHRQKAENLLPCKDSNPDSHIVQPIV
jgi:hypothetical protein